MTILKTNTPLDGWLGGGIPLEGITLVTGTQGSGKTALLRALAAERATPQTPTAYISSDQKYPGGFCVQQLDDVMQLVGQLHTMNPKPVILIDDATSYGVCVTDGPAAGARIWANFVRNSQVREHSVVMAAQTRKVRLRDPAAMRSVLGRGPTFAADIILTTEVQASIHNGLVLRITCQKMRWMDTAKMKPFLMAVVHDDELGWRGEAA